MALFGKKKDDQEVKAAASDEKATSEKKTGTPVVPKLSADRDLATVIKRPRITEKAALALDKNVYTFEIRQDATKHDVRDAIKAIYEVTPVKVRIVKKTPRHYVSRMRGRSMMDKGLKKAYVYLKEGDRIDLV